MNSVHSISAMDISPPCSPTMALPPIPSNQYLLNTFTQHQELLSNMLSRAPNRNDHSLINTYPPSDDNENHSNSLCLFTTVLTENTTTPPMPDESNHVRQRVVTANPVPASTDSQSVLKKRDSRSSFSKLMFTLPLLLLVTYLTVQYLRKPLAPPRASNLQNASDYLAQNLIGQEQALREFKDAMDKHKNFSIVLIEVSFSPLSVLLTNKPICIT